MSNFSITVIDKHTQAENVVEQKELSLGSSPSIVSLSLQKEAVKSMVREGDALVITLLSGETVIVHGFFRDGAPIENDIIFADPDGNGYWQANFDADGQVISYTHIDSVEPLLINDDTDPALIAWLLTAAGAGAIIANHDDDSHPAPQTPPDKPIVNQNNLDGLGGTGEPGKTVVLTKPDGTTATTTVDENGNWKFQPNPLGDGQEGTVVIVDENGLSSEPVDTGIADVTPPNKPVVEQNNEDGLAGTAEPGTVITVTDKDGNVIGSTVVDDDGNWKVQPNPLEEGEEAEVTATDKAGNESGPADTGAIISIKAGIDAVTGDGLVNDTEHASGITLEGALTGSYSKVTGVKVTIGDKTYEAVVSEDGSRWSLSLTSDQIGAAGVHDITVVATAANGAGVSEVSKEANGQYEVVSGSDLSVSVTLNTVAGDDIVNAAEAKAGVTLTGSLKTAGEGALSLTVTVAGKTFVYGTDTELTVNRSDNTWSLKLPGTLLASGHYDIQVKAALEDQAGNIRTASDNGGYAVELSIPAAPTLEVIDSTGEITGVVPDGATTDEVTPLFQGTGEPGATLELIVLGTGLARSGSERVRETVKVGADGKWSLESPIELAEGTYTVIATQKDAAGNQSGEVRQSFEVDLTGPDIGELTLQINNVTADNVVNVNEAKGQIEISGKVTATANGEFQPGDKVTLLINGVKYITTVDARGNWSVMVKGTDLAADKDSMIDAVFTATDRAGNPSDVIASKGYTYADGSEVSVTVTLDTIAGDDLISAAEHANGVTLGGSLSGFYDSVTSVTVTIAGKTHDAVVSQDGKSWSLFLDADQIGADGLYDVKVEATVATDAGNSTKGSAEGQYTVMLGGELAIAVTVDSVAGDNVVNADEAKAGVNLNGTLTLTGEGTLNLSITVGGKTFVYGRDSELTVNESNGTWSLTLPNDLLGNGSYSIQAQASLTDAAGNVRTSSDSGSYVVNLTPPEGVVISIEMIAGDDIVNQNEASSALQHEIRGQVTGEFTAGDVVTVTVGGWSTTAQLDAEGKWSVNVAGDVLAAADRVEASVKAHNAVGNSTVQNADREYVVDLSGPNDETTVLAIFDVTADNLINRAESQEVTTEITGLVSGEFSENDTVTLIINDTAYTTKVGADGRWTVMVDTADLVADSDKIIEGSVLATDEAGNQGEVKADKTYSHNDGSDLVANITVNTIAGDNIVNASEAADDVVITGKINGVFSSVVNGQVTLVINGESFIVKVAADNTWSLKVPAGLLVNGSYEILAQAQVQDVAGNTAQANGLGEYIVDLDGPNPDTTVVHIDTIAGDNIVNSDEALQSHALTGTVSGEFQVGDRIIVLVGGETYETTVQAGSQAGLGVWTVPGVPGRVLAGDNTVIVTLEASDKVGNIGRISNSKNYLVDLDTPDAPTLEVIDNAGTITGAVADGATTDETRPVFKGIGDPGAKLELVVVGDDGGELIRETVMVDADGNWSIASPVELVEDTYTVTATQTDAAGNQSGKASQSFEVDLTGPAVGELTLLIDDVTADNIVNQTEADGTIDISGQVVATEFGEFRNGDKIILTINGKTFTTTVDADGKWSLQVDGSDLAEDSDTRIDVVFKATDAAGNSSDVTASKSYTYADGSEVSVTVTLDTIAGDDRVNATEHANGITLQGSLSGPYDTVTGVTVTIDGTRHTAVVSEDGRSWSLSLNSAQIGMDGLHKVIVDAAVETDAGNAATGKVEGEYTVMQGGDLSIAVTVDTVAGDDVVNADEAKAGVNLTGTLTLTGDGETIKLSVTVGGRTFVYGTDSELTIDQDNGTWSLVLPESLLTDGNYSIQVQASLTDIAGNVRNASDNGSYVVNLAPPKGVIISIDTVAGDDIVNQSEAAADQTQVLKGKVSGEFTAGDIVTVTVGSWTTSTQVDAEGNWHVDVAGNVLAATNKVDASIEAHNAVGNSIVQHASRDYVVDLLPPSSETTTLTIAHITADNVINVEESQQLQTKVSGQVSGEFKENDSVTLLIDGTTYTAKVAADGSWSVMVDTQDLVNDADHIINGSVLATDKAGNQGEVIANKSYEYNDGRSLQGSITVDTIAGDNIVNKTEAAGDVVISGKVNGTFDSVVNGQVTVTINGESVVVTVDADNLWSLKVPASLLAKGNYEIKVQAQVQDGDGNTAAALGESSYAVILDGPNPGTTTVHIDTIAGDNIVNATEAQQTHVLSGTVSGVFKVGDAITVQVGGETYTTTVQAGSQAGQGIWTVPGVPGSVLAGDSSVIVTVIATDTVGNTGSISNSKKYLVDIATPAAPTLEVIDNAGTITGAVADGATTDETRPVFKGTGEAGAKLELVVVGDNGGELIRTTVTVDSEGKWSLTSPVELVEDTYTVTARQTDAAGNQSGSASQRFEVDLTGPDVSKLTLLIDDVTDDNVVNAAEGQGQIELTGQVVAEVGGEFRAGDKLTLVINGVSYTTTVAADGTWSVDVEGSDLAADSDSKIDASFIATDAAGNASTLPGSKSYTYNDGRDLKVSVSVDTPIAGDDMINAAEHAAGVTLTGTLSGVYDNVINVIVDINGTTYTALVDGTTWRLDLPAAALRDGRYDVEVTAVVGDLYGNSSRDTDTADYIVDTAAPTQPVVIEGYIDRVGEVQGEIEADQSTTDDRNPVLYGQVSLSAQEPLQPGDVINIYGTADGSRELLGSTTIDADGSWMFTLPDLVHETTYVFDVRMMDKAGNEGAISNQKEVTVDLVVNVNTQNTVDSTPIISGSTGFDIREGEYLEVTVNGVTYSSQNGEVVIDLRNNTWYVQIPDGNALNVGTYDIAAVLKRDDTVITTDKSANELKVDPAPTVSVGSGGANSDQKATGLTMDENGQWLIFSNQAVMKAVGTDNGSLGDFDVTTLESQVGGVAGRDKNFVQTGVWMDFNRDGYMDFFGLDSSYENGQQAFINNGDGTFTAKQIGYQNYGIATSGETNADQNGNAYTRVWYGGVIAFDKNGDGYVDIAYGDQSSGDPYVTLDGQGYTLDTWIVLNRDGTLEGMHKDWEYVYRPEFGAVRSEHAITNSGNGLSDMENSAVDINNDGTVDIAFHGTESNSKIGGAGTSQAVSTDWSRLVISKNQGDGSWETEQILNGVFKNYDSNPDIANGHAMTWADFNGDGYLDLFMGRTRVGKTVVTQMDESVILFNDGKGNLISSTADNTGIGTADVNSAYFFGDNLVGGASIAVDWNHDGKLDIIETSTVSSLIAADFNVSQAEARNQPVNLYINETVNGVVNFSTSNLLGAGNTIGTANDEVTGAIVADIDWNGSKDLLVFTQGGNTRYIANENEVAHGTSLHFKILDQNGINALMANNVQLFDSAGNLVATRTINPQAGNQTGDSSAIVDFYGLDANETYTVVLLRNINGEAAHVGGLAQVGGLAVVNVNSAWTNIKAGEANHAYVLTAEAGGSEGGVDRNVDNNANAGSGIVGTGYNDTFYATQGTDIYNGGGGTVEVSDFKSWSNTGGMDIVDYQLAGTRALSIDLSNTGQQNVGFGTATFINIEGVAGASGNDTFIGNRGDNFFEGRGGNDTFHLKGLSNTQAGGQDTLTYKTLAGSENDAVGGNGFDTIHGFHVGTWEATPEADRIDLADLLIGYAGSSGDKGGAKYINSKPTIVVGDTIEQYLSVNFDGTDTTVSIDRDGSGSRFSSQDLLVLKGVDVDLATLLANHQISIV